MPQFTHVLVSSKRLFEWMSSKWKKVKRIKKMVDTRGNHKMIRNVFLFFFFSFPFAVLYFYAMAQTLCDLHPVHNHTSIRIALDTFTSSLHLHFISFTLPARLDKNKLYEREKNKNSEEIWCLVNGKMDRKWIKWKNRSVENLEKPFMLIESEHAITQICTYKSNGCNKLIFFWTCILPFVQHYIWFCVFFFTNGILEIATPLHIFFCFFLAIPWSSFLSIFLHYVFEWTKWTGEKLKSTTHFQIRQRWWMENNVHWFFFISFIDVCRHFDRTQAQL